MLDMAKIEIEYNKFIIQYPYLRKGHLLFVAASRIYPEQTEELTATEYDCWNDDDKMGIFKQKLQTMEE